MVGGSEDTINGGSESSQRRRRRRKRREKERLGIAKLWNRGRGKEQKGGVFVLKGNSVKVLQIILN